MVGGRWDQWHWQLLAHSLSQLTPPFTCPPGMPLLTSGLLAEWRVPPLHSIGRQLTFSFSFLQHGFSLQMSEYSAIAGMPGSGFYGLFVVSTLSSPLQLQLADTVELDHMTELRLAEDR